MHPLRIAYFSPLPPERSGIADYSRELLPHLARYADLTLYTARPERLDRELHDQFELRDLHLFPEEHRRYDLALYQMGNSEYHEPFFPLMMQYPGVVVLHDYYLHHFIAHRTIGAGSFAAYARELGYVLGEDGMHLAQDIRLGRKPIPVYELPLNDRILEVSLGLIVHSDFVAKKVRQQGFNLPLHVVPLIVESRPGQSRRTELNLASEDVLFASFGLITTAKQIEFALRAFKHLRQTVPNAHYLLVGETMGDANPEAVIREMDLTNVVHYIGYVADKSSFMDWIHTADVVINLRYPTVGETSATALRAMGAGRPIIVFDHGWYGEIPDGAAVKVPPMDQEALLDAMVQFAKSSELRKQVGQAALRYTEDVCHPSVVAEAYIAALYANLNIYWQRYG